MTKKLRSVVLEKIPFDLRVEIELLSRRRDLIPKEKLEKLIELFRASELDILPIGPGTNRFGFKLNGFAVKIATNDEGKIDNLKEFKMAKRLYPYVIKVHEVSTNGSILVCEYIQPFISYSEMCMYSDQIKKILRELSSVYLIGDVGINPQNYGNWGLRMGTNDPVCLDFAYVYSVSSSLFTCIDIKCKGFMIPDDDFVGLHCNQCGHKYSFQDIRARLANDLHSLEIGDLTKEGYELRESDTIVELDTERSNYLLANSNKGKKAKKKVIETEEEIPFIMENPSKYKEEKAMSIARVISVTEKMIENGDITIPHVDGVKKNPEPEKKTNISGESRQPKVTVTAKEDEPAKTIDEIAQESLESMIGAGEADHPTDNGGLAFSAKITATPKDEVVDVEPTAVEETSKQEDPKPVKNEEQVDIPVDVKPKADTPAFTANVTPKAEVKVKEKEEEKTTDESERPRKRTFDIDEFKDIGDLARATSIIARKISDYCQENDIYSQIQSDLNDKRLFKDGFYRILSGSVYVSLMNFIGFQSQDVPSYNGNRTRKEFTPPAHSLKGTPQEPTVIFIMRVYNTREINQTPTAEDLMTEYKQCYKDYYGIQESWLKIFQKNILKKTSISNTGMVIIKNMIADLWCVPDMIISPIEKPPAPGTGAEATVVEESEEVVEAAILESSDDTTTDSEIEEEVEDLEEDFEDSDDEDNDDECDCDECDDDCCCSEDEKIPISVYLYPDDKGIDVIRLNAPNEYGKISIPMYTVLSDIDINEADEPVSYPQNGVFDWLKNQAPDIMFRTQDPDRWLKVNETMPFNEEVGTPRFIILGTVHTNQDPETYIVAMYYLTGIYTVDDDGNPSFITDNILLEKINRVLRKSTSGYISHYVRTMAAIELIRDESYMDEIMRQMQEEIMAENELAAINVVLGNAGPDAKIDGGLINKVMGILDKSDPVINANVVDNVQKPVQQKKSDDSMMITPIIRSGANG